MTSVLPTTHAHNYGSRKQVSSFFLNRYTLVLAGATLFTPLWQGLYNPSQPDRIRPAAQVVQSDEFTRSKPFLWVKPLYQKNSNACGTTALAMALNALAAKEHQDPHYQPFTREELDQFNREWNSFSSPNMLVRIAQKHHAYAQMINNSTFEDVREHLDQGHPVVALISVDREDALGALHYVLIHDYKDSPILENRTITYTDPASGSTQVVRYNDFVKNHAENLKMGTNLPTLFNRFVIVLSSQDDLPHDSQVPVTNMLAGGVQNLVNNVGLFARGLYGRVVSPLMEMFSPASPPQDRSSRLLK